MSTDNPFVHEKLVVCVNESPDALKVTPVHPHKPVPFWVPKSVLHDDSEVYGKGHEGKLVVQRWFGEKEGWDEA